MGSRFRATLTAFTDASGFFQFRPVASGSWGTRHRLIRNWSSCLRVRECSVLLPAKCIEATEHRYSDTDFPIMPKATFQMDLRSLYFGESPRARRFRYGLIAFDVLTMAIFILASAARDQWWLIPLDLVLAVVLSVELAALLYVEENRRGNS